jgi:hypothetical protein
MKKLLMVLCTLFFTCSVWGQSGNEIEITWLTSDSTVNGIGLSSVSGSTTLAAFMEFSQDDIFNFKTTGKRLTTISQVKFYIATKTAVSAAAIVLLQGDAITSATEVVNQPLTISSLTTGGWNEITLSSPYTIDPSKNLYIGYQLKVTGQTYPFSVANCTNSKQSHFLIDNTTYTSIASYQWGFLIKALADTVTPPEIAAQLTGMFTQPTAVQGDRIHIVGNLHNFGTMPITAFKAIYSVNGRILDTLSFTGLNIAANGGDYEFTYSPLYSCDSVGIDTFRISIIEPNDSVSGAINNDLWNKTIISPIRIQRVVLHEVFTSSTCPPCKNGNIQLHRVLDVCDTAKWAVIKYQVDFPGDGDPYYTNEVGIRSTFYNRIMNAPTLMADGGSVKINPNSYVVEYFDYLAQFTALANMSGTAEVDAKTVKLNVDIAPTMKIDNPNIRLFAAIVEKQTYKNVKNNGETSFFYVMKKFITSPDGDAIDTFDANVPISRSLEYTFNGDYSLPANAYNTPINHSIEHSVENFGNLMLVFWLQDIVTWEIYQAGTVPNPIVTNVSIAEANIEMGDVELYPNPVRDLLTVKTHDVTVRNLEIYNVQGQRVAGVAHATEISTAHLAAGVYMLRITGDKGVITRKFVKQ